MKYDELFSYANNRLLNQSQNDFNGSFISNENDLAFSTKQKYFINWITKALEHVYYISKDISDESILWEIGKGFATTGLMTGAAKFGTKLLSKSESLSSATTVATGILSAIYAANNIKDKTMAKAKAAKFMRFIENKDSSEAIDLNCGAKFASELALEFKLGIEMLVKSEEGIDILAEYIVENTVKLIDNISNSKLDKFNMDHKIDYLKEGLVHQNIPTGKKLKNEHDQDLKWYLHEFLRHAPIILTYFLRQDMYKFSFYHNTSEHKRRGLFKEMVSAEGSHKYPPRIMFSEAQVNMLPGYTKSKGNNQQPTPATNVIPDFQKTINKNNSAICFIEFYDHVRKLSATKWKKQTSKQINDVLRVFIDISEECLNTKCSSNFEWFNLFVEMQTLRNIYCKILMPIVKAAIKKINEKIKDEPKKIETNRLKSCLDSCLQAREIYNKMTTMYTNEEKIKKTLEAKKQVNLFFDSRLDRISMVELSKDSLVKQTHFLQSLLSNK